MTDANINVIKSTHEAYDEGNRLPMELSGRLFIIDLIKY